MVMGASNYDEMVKVIVSDENTYIKLKSDPTSMYRKKLVNILDHLKEWGKLAYVQNKDL